MRKLAHVEKIDKLTPIKGADKIEVAHILGWECVVKKGEFKEGDKVIYCEVDSVLPEKPEFEFLRSRKFRIKTIKLRGQISQGLVLPLDSLSNVSPEVSISFVNIGDDVTKYIGITKYITPSERKEIEQLERKMQNDKNKLRRFMMRYSWFRSIFLSKSQKSKFPFWVSKTDEERIQNMPHVLSQFKDKEVYVTEKIDYQSATFTGELVPKYNWMGKYSPKKYKFVVCSRNMTNNNKDSLYWQVAKKYNLETILKNNPHLTIQGEQGDTKVQGNKYGISEPTLWVFNIFDHKKKRYYHFREMENFCESYGLNTVPLIWEGWLKDLGSNVQDLVEYSKGKSVINKKIQREGVVIRCIENGKKILSFKVINPKFLLKYEN